MYKVVFVSMVLLSGCAALPPEPSSQARAAEANSASSGGNPGSIGNTVRSPPATAAAAATAKITRKALENGDTARDAAGAE